MIGLLLIVGGVIALIVARSSGTAPGVKRPLGQIAGLVVALGIVITLVTQVIRIIPVGSVGVAQNQISGGLRTLVPGTHFVLPGIETVELYNTRLQEITLSRRGEGGPDVDESINARSKEGLEISIDVTVQLQVNVDRVVELHRNIGRDYLATVVVPNIRSKVRDAVGQFSAADLISTQRKALENAVIEGLRADLEQRNLTLLGVLLRELRIPQSVAKVIEEKQTAEQQVAIERNRLQQANIAAQRKVVEAEGEAKAAIARAEGEAKALSLRGQALKQNPDIVQLTVAEKLSPSIQTILLPATGNFLLDFNSLTRRSPASATPAQ